MPFLKCLLAAIMIATVTVGPAAATEEDAWRALQEGAIVLFRHANAPGTGDPPGMVLGDCSTQRNLDEAGRIQARRIGQAFEERRVAVGKVLTSQWCRAVDTAELAFPGRMEAAPAFNSFFGRRDEAERQTADASRQMLEWAGPGALVVVTHQVNITALTDVFPASGEGVVLQRQDGRLTVVGRIRP